MIMSQLTEAANHLAFILGDSGQTRTVKIVTHDPRFKDELKIFESFSFFLFD